jgi:hypothetical protein
LIQDQAQPRNLDSKIHLFGIRLFQILIPQLHFDRSNPVIRRCRLNVRIAPKRKHASAPEVLEPIGGQLGISNRVLNVLVAEPCLQRVWTLGEPFFALCISAAGVPGRRTLELLDKTLMLVLIISL